VLPYAIADGPHNMAADEVLLHSAREGRPALRFYGWSPATLSLGYFQAERVRHADPRWAALPFVRRPTGGEMLVHDQELTYALALPAGSPWQTRAASWLGRMHGIIAAALRTWGVAAQLCEPHAGRHLGGPLCFRHFTAGDLILHDAKIAGSAQRKQRGALLQHGAVLLARSPHTPTLPGIRELTGLDLGVADVADSICQEFARQTRWQPVADDWTERECSDTAKLAASRYAQDDWNRKR
jgi:lipoate-protein ligase A